MNVNAFLRRRFRVGKGDTLPLKTHGCSRVTLAKAFAELGYKAGAEIVVQKGDYSLVLCASIPGLHLKCVDSWDQYTPRISQGRQDLYMARTAARLAPYDVELIKKTSMEAVKDVPDRSLDFVYIDAMHEFDYVMQDLIEWSKKVKSGGIVSGHDYSNVHYQYGIIPAVLAYTGAHTIYQWYITSDDLHPSYFWVKP